MSDDAWVSDLLSDQPTPAIPAAVAARIDQAIAQQALNRQLGTAASVAKQVALELNLRSSQGSFGANAPTHYDKVGLGIAESQKQTH